MVGIAPWRFSSSLHYTMQSVTKTVTLVVIGVVVEASFDRVEFTIDRPIAQEPRTDPICDRSTGWCESIAFLGARDPGSGDPRARLSYAFRKPGTRHEAIRGGFTIDWRASRLRLVRPARGQCLRRAGDRGDAAPRLRRDSCLLSRIARRHWSEVAQLARYRP